MLDWDISYKCDYTKTKNLGHFHHHLRPGKLDIQCDLLFDCGLGACSVSSYCVLGNRRND